MLVENQKDKVRFIPKKGFNVVGIDDYEIPGEQLYLVGHFDNESAAKAALGKFQKTNPGTLSYIYSPETK